jgi:hypothetical protein
VVPNVARQDRIYEEARAKRQQTSVQSSTSAQDDVFSQAAQSVVSMTIQNNLQACTTRLWELLSDKEHIIDGKESDLQQYLKKEGLTRSTVLGLDDEVVKGVGSFFKRAAYNTLLEAFADLKRFKSSRR